MKKRNDIEPALRKKILDKLPTSASLRFWSLFCLVAGLIFLSIASCFIIQSVLFKRNAYGAQGEVVNMVYADILHNKILYFASSIGARGGRRNHSRNAYAHYPVVEFTDQYGTEHRLQSPTSRGGRYMKRIHTCVPKDIIYKGIVFKNCVDTYTVSVLFSPHNPHHFMIDDGQPWFVIAYEVLGILLVIFSIILWWGKRGIDKLK